MKLIFIILFCVSCASTFESHDSKYPYERGIKEHAQSDSHRRFPEVNLLSALIEGILEGLYSK